MKRALITGANRGIGLALTQQLVARGVAVVAGCRGPSPVLDELGVDVHTLDVADAASVRAFADGLDGDLDLVVHNAGVLSAEALGGLDDDGIRRQFEVNALGPLRLTDALRSHLANPSKVAIITSRMGSIDDNDSGGMYGYRMSKAAVNAVGKSLSIDLKSHGVAVALLHPGFVKTEMTGGRGLIDAETSAAGLLARIDALSLSETGGFWHMNGDRLPW